METRLSEEERCEDLQRWLGVVRQLPEVRREKIARIRLALENRTYENDFVLDQTVKRLSSDVAWLR